MDFLLRSTILASVLLASLFVGIRGPLVLASAGPDEGCAMSCCVDVETASSCCVPDEREVVLVSPCGCDGKGHGVGLELNGVDWTPPPARALEAPLPERARSIPVHRVPRSRSPMPETGPPRA